MTEFRLIKVITQRLEDYGMPKFKDYLPAVDILQLIKDSGYINIKDINKHINNANLQASEQVPQENYKTKMAKAMTEQSRS